MVQRFDAHNAGFYAQVRRLGFLLVGFETLLFLVSWTLLLYASTQSFESHPRWIGPLDGVIALAVVNLVYKPKTLSSRGRFVV